MTREMRSRISRAPRPRGEAGDNRQCPDRFASERLRAHEWNNWPVERPSMIRSQLVQKLAARNPELNLQEVDRIVSLIFDSIGERLADGGRVELRGFGAFTTRARDGRTGRNPRTGVAVTVPAKRVPHFKPGKEMRERLNPAR